jgi:hypothetical protein
MDACREPIRHIESDLDTRPKNPFDHGMKGNMTVKRRKINRAGAGHIVLTEQRALFLRGSPGQLPSTLTLL